MDALPEVLSHKLLANSFLGDLVQIGLVTRDSRRAMEDFVRLGIGPWTIRTADEASFTDVTYRGEPTRFAARFCLAETRNMFWEIVEPLAGASIHKECLDRHGEGVQRLVFNCDGMDFEERLHQFARRGLEPVQTFVYLGQIPVHLFACRDGRTIFELYRVPPGLTLPEPDDWYPAPPPR